jgi:hypothetical protein
MHVKKAVTTGICLHRDTLGGTWRGSFAWNFERQAKNGFGDSALSHGIWREGTCAGDPDRYVKKKNLENYRAQLAC